MANMHEKKIGFVRLTQKNGRWLAAWWNAEQRRYVRRLLPAENFKQAESMAGEINKGLLSAGGFLPTMRNNRNGISIVEAITQTIANSKAGNKCRRDYKSAAEGFLSWLAEYCPGLEMWAELRPSHISQYLTFCESQGLAYDTIRMRLYIVKAASRFMSEEYERFKDIARRVKIQKPENTIDNVAPMISAESVRAYIEHAGSTDIDKAAMLSLMAYCGLRIWEAAYLRECDIDLQAATIKIDITPHHKPKSRGSRRLIPIPRQVCQMLGEVISKNKVKGNDCYIFQSGRRATHAANIGQGWSMSGVASTLRKAIKKAYRDTRRDDLKGFVPRRLRSFFVSTITAAGAPDVYVRRYIGHAPLNVMEKHYLKIDLETLRKEICGRIEAILGGERANQKAGGLTSNLH